MTLTRAAEALVAALERRGHRVPLPAARAFLAQKIDAAADALDIQPAAVLDRYIDMARIEQMADEIVVASEPPTEGPTKR